MCHKFLASLLVSIIVLCCNAATGRNCPVGLMTDLVGEASNVYRNGFRTDKTVDAIPDAELGSYSFAAIRSSRPVLGWIVPSCGTATCQLWYQIVVSDNLEDAIAHKGNVWDSGRVESNESVSVPYCGPHLQPSKTYFWSVRLATNTGGESDWSHYMAFRTADSLKPYAPSYRPQQCSRDAAVIVDRVDSNCTFIDFGRAAYGQLELTLTSNSDTDTVTVAIGEDAIDRHVNAKPHGTVRYYTYRLPLSRGRHTYHIVPNHDKRNTGPAAVLMPAEIGEVAPFRFCQIDGYSKAITINDAARINVSYPFDDNASYFKSSNSLLNSIWHLCKYSIKATSALGVYIDGDRERIPYEADAIINQLGHYGVDREYSMARRTLEYLLDHPTWPTEWILQAPIIAWNDYLYCGDIRSIEANYELLKARSLISLSQKNGLISTTVDGHAQSREFLDSIRLRDNIRDIVDWPRVSEDDGFVFADYNCVVNAYYYNAVNLLARMASLLDRNDEAKALEMRASVIMKAFNSAFFDSKAGAYRDGIGVDHHSLHSSMFALAFGLVKEKDVPRVLDFIRSRGMACSVYGAQFLLDALYAVGDYDHALSLLTSREKRSWANMLDCGTTITYEAWDDTFKPNQDWNHAWGAAPANILPRHIAGVEPLEPGCRTISVAPKTSSLKRVDATVPTIRGEVKVSIDNAPGCYKLKVTIPANTKAQVSLPLMAKRFGISINGALAKAKSSDRRVEVGTLQSGTYEIVMNY